MMTDDTSLQRACPSPNTTTTNTNSNTSLALLASVASIAPIQVGGGKRPSVILKKNHDGQQNTIISTICTAGGTKQDLKGIRKGAATTNKTSKIIRKVSLTSTEDTQARIGAALRVDTGRVTCSRSNKKIKLTKETARQNPTAASAPASASAASAASASSTSSAGAAEKMAIKGVSFFLREMKSGNPQDMVGSMDTMALCLRTEDALGRNDYARTLFAVNGYQIILTAMKQWNHHEAIQRAGCNCLCIMTEPLLDPPPPSDQDAKAHQENKKNNNGKRTSSASGASASTPRTNVLTLLLIMEAVIHAMRTFPRSFAIQRNAIATLDNCCDQFFTTTSVATSTLATTKANKRAQNRFVQLLLHHHHHQGHPQQEGQGQDGQQGSGGGAGGGGGGAVYLVTRAMKIFPQVLDLQVVGCSFIYTLVSSTSSSSRNINKEECWNALKQHHAMSTVTAAYENHPNNDDIKHHLQNIMDRMLLF